MSVQAITRALALSGVSPSEKLVLLVLANYADEHFACWPSQAVLAADTCMSERGVRKVLAGLEERGVIDRAERRRSDGYRAADLIRLDFEAISPAPRSPEHGSPEPRSPEPDVDLTGTGCRAVRHVKEPSEPSPPIVGDGARAGAGTRLKSRRCPEAYQPGPRVLVTAEAEGFTPGEIERELAKFRDHQFRDAHTDWDAAFRNWLRRAAEQRPRHERPHHSQQRDNLVAAFAGSEIAARQRQRFGGG